MSLEYDFEKLRPTLHQLAREADALAMPSVQLRHNYNTDDMEHRVPELIEFATTLMTMLSSDIIACGTNRCRMEKRSRSRFK